MIEEKVRAYVERHFKTACRVERQTKKGRWKEVPVEFFVGPSREPFNLCRVSWVYEERKRSATVRAWHSGRGWVDSEWGRYLSIGDTYTVEQEISLTPR